MDNKNSILNRRKKYLSLLEEKDKLLNSNFHNIPNNFQLKNINYDNLYTEEAKRPSTCNCIIN